ncbi:MAG: hypothetical protein ABSF15_22710 [Candidatus Sulfotelmatobacter sp.]|jgi:hypothetical protein
MECLRITFVDVTCSKRLRLWILRLSDAISGFREVVQRMSKLNSGAKEVPVRIGLPKRHSHTARIQNPSASDPPVKLHVGVTADDDGYIESVKNW